MKNLKLSTVLLFFCLFCTSVQGQQKFLQDFSITDQKLMDQISQSAENDLSIAVVDSSGVETSRVVNISKELYYQDFLRSVNQLRQAVQLKMAIAALSGGHPKIKNNPEALLKVAKMIYLQAYPKKSYAELWEDVVNRYTIFKTNFNDPEIAISSLNERGDVRKNEVEFAANMSKSAGLIMDNLDNRKNRASNAKLAQDGVQYYQEKIKILSAKMLSTKNLP